MLPIRAWTPTALKQFYKSIKELASGIGGERSQILISSHSPFVICEAWNGEDRDFIHQVKIQKWKIKTSELFFEFLLFTFEYFLQYKSATQ